MAVLSSLTVDTFALKAPFVIARGSKTEAQVVAVRLTDGDLCGHGECTPYGRYGETLESVSHAIRTAAETPGCLDSREVLAVHLPPGAARNALDCALWDLEAKRAGKPAATLAGHVAPAAVETCFTLSLDTPDAMANAACRVPRHRLLKLKLGGKGDAERMKAVRHARPDARLVADANEAWTQEMLEPFLDVAVEARFELIEQPLPADADAALAHIPRGVPVCADESAHAASDIARLAARYDAVNIKLDKAGGLTEALVMRKAARQAGLKIMVGSMVASSLAIAPAFLLAQDADWVDLDGPLLLASDREPPAVFEHGLLHPPPSQLWG